MYILTAEGKSGEGAYSVLDEDGEQILYLFEEEDDAYRFALMLENSDYPEMEVVEVDDELIIKACEFNDYQYSIITKDDIVIPPDFS
jgi:hypothetical protein